MCKKRLWRQLHQQKAVHMAECAPTLKTIVKIDNKHHTTGPNKAVTQPENNTNKKSHDKKHIHKKNAPN
jgi:hydroxyacyl-ACP dehydratase HTD2-like protein with hotdog domain